MKLQNAIFYVKNITESKKFYLAIGFEVEKDFGGYVSFKNSGGSACLAINQSDKPEKVPGKQTASFLVEDIDTYYQKITKNSSIQVIKELVDEDYGKTFSFSDPDGNKIEFVEETIPERKTNQKYIYKHEDATKFNKHGIDLTVFNEEVGSANVVAVEVEEGHFQEFQDKESTYIYYIFEGAGTFILNDKSYEAEAGDLVVIPPMTRIHYFGKMRMSLTVTPAFKAENEIHVKFIEKRN